ncbi:5793_t:CDS:2, partial [Dentiscutata heterogama]
MIYERGLNMASQLKSTSRLASILWQDLTFDDKEIYLKIADIAKKVHSCIWPNYRYKPYKKDQILLSTFQSAGTNLKCQYCVKSSIFQPASFNMIHYPISESIEVSAMPRDYLYSPSKFISPLKKQPIIFPPLETRQNTFTNLIQYLCLLSIGGRDGHHAAWCLIVIMKKAPCSDKVHDDAHLSV